MYINGTVTIFNTTIFPVDLTLNGVYLRQLPPVAEVYGYTPFPPLIVDRFPVTQPYGEAIFGHTNIMQVHMKTFQITYQINIDPARFLIDWDLQLYIFANDVILTYRGKPVATGVERIKESETAPG